MKVFFRFLILVAVLGIIGIIIVGMSLNALVKTGVEAMGPKVLGVPVILKEADISLLSGGKDMRVSLNELIIKNPDEYETDYAFSLSKIRVIVDRNSLLTSTVVIDEIIIDSPVITFEGSLLGSNLGDIQDNLKRSTGSEPDDEVEEKTEKHEDAEEPKKHGDGEESEKHVHIKKLTMRNAKINLSLFGKQTEAIFLTLPDFKLRDIGKASGGTSFPKASAKIFDAIYGAVIKAVSKPGKLIPKSFEQFRETAEEIGKSAEKFGKELLKGLPSK